MILLNEYGLEEVLEGLSIQDCASIRPQVSSLDLGLLCKVVVLAYRQGGEGENRLDICVWGLDIKFEEEPRNTVVHGLCSFDRIQLVRIDIKNDLFFRAE